MELDDLRRGLIAAIDAYLSGQKTWEDVSNWALEQIIQHDITQLPRPVREGLLAVFDLHDRGMPWAPTSEELTKCRRLLELQQGEFR